MFLIFYMHKHLQMMIENNMKYHPQYNRNVSTCLKTEHQNPNLPLNPGLHTHVKLFPPMLMHSTLLLLLHGLRSHG